MHLFYACIQPKIYVIWIDTSSEFELCCRQCAVHAFGSMSVCTIALALFSTTVSIIKRRKSKRTNMAKQVKIDCLKTNWHRGEWQERKKMYRKKKTKRMANAMNVNREDVFFAVGCVTNWCRFRETCESIKFIKLQAKTQRNSVSWRSIHFRNMFGWCSINSPFLYFLLFVVCLLSDAYIHTHTSLCSSHMSRINKFRCIKFPTILANK